MRLCARLWFYLPLINMVFLAIVYLYYAFQLYSFLIFIYLLLEILPQRRRHDDERPVDEVDDAVGHRDVGLHDVGDDVLARVVPVALHRV